jgi:hypothetical protein
MKHNLYKGTPLKMKTRTTQTWMILSAALFFSGCGASHMMLVKQPDHLTMPQSVSVAKVEFTAEDADQDDLPNNEKIKKAAADEILALLAQKKIAVAADAHPTIACRIKMTYGSRALRYWVGFGAGKGSIDVDLEMKDEKGTILYATNAKADLAIGAFGGDMTDVAVKAVKDAVADFGTRI